MNFTKIFTVTDSVERSRFLDGLKRFVVLVAWFGIYAGLYVATKDSPASQLMKAHSVNRMGLLPPSENGVSEKNNYEVNGGQNAR